MTELTMPACTVAECDKPAKSVRRGLCSMHQARVDRHGDVSVGPPEGGRYCGVDGCGKATERRSNLCDMHHQRFVRNGDPLVGGKRDPLVCIIKGCDTLATKRNGVCSAHRAQLRKDGIGVSERIEGDDLARFFAKLVLPLSVFDCWQWTGACNSGGYGVLQIDGRTASAHRFAYEQFVGPIGTDEDGRTLSVDHVCHTTDLSCVGGALCPHRRCVNPFHMEAVTFAENVRRIQRSARKPDASLYGGN